MRNINISVSGINADYITLTPKSLDYLPGRSSRNITVRINAPIYFSLNKYTLVFDITGKLFPNGTNEVTQITDRRAVTLYITGLPHSEANTYLNDSLDAIFKMNQTGMILTEVKGLYKQLNDYYNNYDFENVKLIYNKIRVISISPTRQQ